MPALPGKPEAARKLAPHFEQNVSIHSFRCYFSTQLHMRTYSNFIGGDWSGAKDGRRSKNFNPADQREFVAEYPLSGREDAAEAIGAAKQAWPAWAAMTPIARGRILSKTSQILESRKAELADIS